jgi:hypothetical protein
MATTSGTIKHRHQSALPTGTSDVDVPQWNDSEVMAGGTNGDACVRDTTKADGWGWTPLGIYAPLNAPAFTGVPTAPTAAAGTNTTQLATTAFVTTAAAAPVWTAVAYSAANFVGTGGMTWTVDSGDQVRFSYLLVGKTMTVSFWFNSTSLTGTATNEIRITIPGGKASAAYSAGIAWLNNPGSLAGIINAPAGQTYLQIYKIDQSNYTLSTNTFLLSGTFTFEVS